MQLGFPFFCFLLFPHSPLLVHNILRSSAEVLPVIFISANIFTRLEFDHFPSKIDF